MSADAEPDDVLLVDGGRDHVQAAGGVDGRQQLLVELVTAPEPEADEAKLNKLIRNVFKKTFIFTNTKKIYEWSHWYFSL